MPFGDFFTSPRERAGRSGYGALKEEAGSLPQSFGDVNDLQDVYKKYGVSGFNTDNYRSQVKSTFDPARRTLANKKARAIQNATRFGNSRSATPGMSFSNIESGFADASANLEGDQAREILGGFDKKTAQDMNIANLLFQSLGAKDSGAYNKFNAKRSSFSDYVNSLSGTSGFDDVLAGARTIGQFAGIPTGQYTSLGGDAFKKIFG